MGLSFGYYGPVSRAQKFVDNPLATVPSDQIQLCDYEIDDVIAQLGLAPWDNLNPSQQRAVARIILQKRGDPESLAQLDMLAVNNPGYHNFIVIHTEQDSQPTGSLLQHFLL